MANLKVTHFRCFLFFFFSFPQAASLSLFGVVLPAILSLGRSRCMSKQVLGDDEVEEDDPASQTWQR
jgi:hypothetical protein